jgi:uncharacterized protein (UPF0332 family)
MKGTKEEYIRYRIEKAKQTLHDAEILIAQKSWNSAINRLYYACFHSVQALLLNQNIAAKTHSGTKSKFFQEFILTGKIVREYGALFSDLQDWRQEGDYADFVEFDQETVEPLPEKVKVFISAIEQLL